VEEKGLAMRRDKRRMDDKVEMIKDRWYNSEGREGLGCDVMDLVRLMFSAENLEENLREVGVDYSKLHWSLVTTRRVNECFGLLGRAQEELLRKMRKIR
jgi:hypothetical protein